MTRASTTQPAIEIMAQPNSSSRSGKPRILVVEDEHDLQELLRFNLAREGYDTLCADSGEQALRLLREEPVDLILLDLMLPGVDGLEICRRIKAKPAIANIPVIMVTAKGEESDVVSGLELGADDYVIKPFSPRVLLARVKAVLRRQQGEEAEAAADQNLIVRDDLVINPDRHESMLDGRPLELTATEFRLLSLLARRPGRVFTRQQIIEAIHGGHSAVTDRSVDVQVVSLRRKLDDDGQRIQTVRGVGYRFRES